MAPASKANYKTYEAQARMVRAIVAAHPDVKWNYKDIAKYFGQSTADGIQFQFRGIKKDADHLRKVEGEGGDVANCLSLGSGGPSVTSTPSKPTPARSTGSRTGTGTGRKRARKMDVLDIIKRSSSDEEDDEIEDWSAHEMTPTKKPKKTGAFPGQRNGTPSRKAAALANVTIAEAATQLDAGDSQPETEAPMNHTFSSFTAEPITIINQPAYTRRVIGLDPGPALASAPSSGYGGSQSYGDSYYSHQSHGEI